MYIGHGESENSTSGPTGSDLQGHFKVKYRYYTQNSAFSKANRTRRSNDLQGRSQGHEGSTLVYFFGTLAYIKS